MIRNLTARDLNRVVAIHMTAFPGFFLTKMGEPFLIRFYSVAISHRNAIAIGIEMDSTLVGFCIGNCEPSSFHSALLKEAHRIIWPIVLAVFRNPSLLIDIINGALRNLRSACSIDDSRESHICELASLGCVSNDKGFGSLMVKEFIRTAEIMGAKKIFLTTNLSENERVIKFYLNLGFSIKGIEKRNNRSLYRFEYQFDP